MSDNWSWLGVALVALWVAMVAKCVWNYLTRRRLPVEVEKALEVVVNAGFDVEKHGVHLYKRLGRVTVLKFPTKGDDPEVDEQFDDLGKAIDRHMDLTAPKEAAAAG